MPTRTMQVVIYGRSYRVTYQIKGGPEEKNDYHVEVWKQLIVDHILRRGSSAIGGTAVPGWPAFRILKISVLSKPMSNRPETIKAPNGVDEFRLGDAPPVPPKPNLDQWEISWARGGFLFHLVCGTGSRITQSTQGSRRKPSGKPFCDSCYRRAGKLALLRITNRGRSVRSSQGWQGRGIVFRKKPKDAERYA